KADHLCHVLVGSCFVFVRSFPALQIPNLQTPSVTDQSNFIFQPDLPAKLFGQNETALPIRAHVLRAGMQMAQKNPAIPRGNALVCFCCRTHSCKLVRRHDEQTLMSRFRQENEFLCLVPSPARRNRDSILLIDGMPELSGVEAFGWRIVVHVSSGGIIHFAPLDTTFNHRPSAGSIKKFHARLRLLTPTVSSSRHEIFPGSADNGLRACRR